MKNIFTHLLVSLLIVSSLSLPKSVSAATPIGTLGTIPTLTVAGRVFTDVTNLIILGGYDSGTNYTTLRKDHGSSGYQVTTGKTLTIYAAKFINGNNNGCSTLFAQADNDSGVGTATTPTNPVYPFGSANNLWAVGASVSTTYELAINMTIAALKYVTVASQGTGACMVYLYGYET